MKLIFLSLFSFNANNQSCFKYQIATMEPNLIKFISSPTWSFFLLSSFKLLISVISELIDLSYIFSETGRWQFDYVKYFVNKLKLDSQSEVSIAPYCGCQCPFMNVLCCITLVNMAPHTKKPQEKFKKKFHPEILIYTN